MSININTEAQKNPDQLEREVNERRAHMGDTLNALEEKLSPGHIFDQVLDYARQNGGEFSQNLLETIKQNPVPTLLTAIGVTWLMYGQDKPASHQSSKSIESYGTGMSNSSTGIKERGTHLKDSLSTSVAEAKHRIGDTADNLRHQAQRASASLRDQSHRVKVGFSQLLEEQPLAVGAIGIAIGALLGGALPSTRQEDEIMGEVKDRVADRAASTVKDTYEKAGDIGRKVIQDTKKEVGATTGSSSYGPQ